MNGSGTEDAPYIVVLGMFTALRMSAIEWYGRSVTGSSPNDVDSLIRAISNTLLNDMDSGSIFRLLAGNHLDPRIFVVYNRRFDGKVFQGGDDPFFSEHPYVAGVSKKKYLVEDDFYFQKPTLPQRRSIKDAFFSKFVKGSVFDKDANLFGERND